MSNSNVNTTVSASNATTSNTVPVWNENEKKFYQISSNLAEKISSQIKKTIQRLAKGAIIKVSLRDTWVAIEVTTKSGKHLDGIIEHEPLHEVEETKLQLEEVTWYLQDVLHVLQNVFNTWALEGMSSSWKSNQFTNGGVHWQTKIHMENEDEDEFIYGYLRMEDPNLTYTAIRIWFDFEK